MATYEILRRSFLILSFTLVLIVCSGCATYFGYDGPYEGKVIDRDTQKPIAGAVVHGTWCRAIPGPGGASSKYYDSKEVLTDKDGNFKIEGAGLLILSSIGEMEVYVFKAGYTFEQGHWSGFKNEQLVDDVEWKGDKAIFKLRRMSLEERNERSISEPGMVPEKKERLFLLEQNRENMELGRPENTIRKVE
jgi:hypothetical protein